ncbi:hypothetical protein TH47_07705 [Thalassospira sp. MCCC 1A02803]|nr:hypothetical protein AUQ41_05160 [Thalassospira sp. MCCC 1A02898]ONH88323.1 hypothetical protein TH47_07705 [Thalassospira sp. MCCC 1A02803]
MLFLSCARFEKRRKFFVSLAKMYLEVILISAFGYFYLILFSSTEGQHLSGTDYLGGHLSQWISDPIKYFSAYFDALYFSVVTITTVGAADIGAVSYPAKMIKSIELLLGLFVLATASLARFWDRSQK